MRAGYPAGRPCAPRTTGLADPALAEANRLRRRRARDEVRAGRDDAALRGEQPVAGELAEQHDREVALQVRLLVDGEPHPPGQHGAQHLGGQVERAELDVAGAAGRGERAQRRLAAVAREREHAVDLRVAQRGGDLALGQRRVAEVDRHDARLAPGGADRAREPAAAAVGALVAGLVVDAQRVADGVRRHAPPGGSAGGQLLLADVGEDAEAAEDVAAGVDRDDGDPRPHRAADCARERRRRDRHDEPVRPARDRLVDELAHARDAVDVGRAVRDRDAHLPRRGVAAVLDDRPEVARRLAVRDDRDADGVVVGLPPGGGLRRGGGGRPAADEVGLADLRGAPTAAEGGGEGAQQQGRPPHGRRSAGTGGDSSGAGGGGAAAGSLASATSASAPHGMRARSCVPAPGGLSTASVPSSAERRSCRPRRPLPRPIRAPPTPSSSTSTVTTSAARRTVTRAVVACAYLTMFVSASATTKYAAASIGPESRSCTSTSHSTGTGTRLASASIAGPRPRSVRIAGWMPRASSRRSASATASFSARPSTSGSASVPRTRVFSRRRSSASATSCCWAPSWRSRSRRRRAASPASTMRTRETRSSSTRARRSAFRRSLSSARAAAAAAAWTSSGPVSSAASWTIAATRTPLRSTAVHARPLPGSGRSTGRPASSTKVLRSGSQ